MQSDASKVKAVQMCAISVTCGASAAVRASNRARSFPSPSSVASCKPTDIPAANLRRLEIHEAAS